MRAVIIKEVQPALGSTVDAFAEREDIIPIMRLEDGQEVLACDCHRYIPLGTEGEATYDESRRAWAFVPDYS